MQKTRKKPERRCVGCNEHKDKRELIRVVKSPEGEIFFDHTGKANGRGAYLCNDAACLQKARKARRLESALKAAIPPEVYERLEQEIQNDGAE